MRGMAYPSRSDLKWFFGLIALGTYGTIASAFLLDIAGGDKWSTAARGCVGAAMVIGSFAAMCGGVGALLKHKKAGAVVGAIIGLSIVLSSG